MNLAVDFVDLPPNGSQAILEAHVDVSPLAPGGNSSPFAVDLLGGVYDASGKAIGTAFGRHNEVVAADVSRVRRDGIGFQQRLALPPGRYEIRFAARDMAKQKLGGSSQWIEIPDLKSGALALSGVFLSKGAPKAGGPGGEAAEDIKDVQALRRFTTKDTLYFQVYVYNLKRRGRRGGRCRAAGAAAAGRDARRRLVAAAGQGRAQGRRPAAADERHAARGPAGGALRAQGRGGGQAVQGHRLARHRLQRGVNAAVTAA